MGGFTDIAPIVREQTLKSVLVFVPKLSDRTINGELLRYLAKTANDEQPGIRTNTTICLGKMAKSLGISSRNKVLIAAFSRSLRDPFVHARNASLLALAATSEYFSPDDIALRILPAICGVLLDKEKLVRDQSTKTMDVFMQRVRKAAAALPDSALPPSTASGDANGAARMSTPQPDQASSSSWAGWAISSFTNKLSAAAGEIESGATTAAPGLSAPTAAQPSFSADARQSRPSPLGTSSASTLHRQAVRSPPASQTMSRNSSSSNVAGDSFFADAADDTIDDDGGDDAWGAMDDGFGGVDGGDAWGVEDDDENEKEDPFKPKKAATTATTSRSASGSNGGSGGVQPFGDDDAEPDFAGWLAAQEAKKKGAITGKSLPRGLSKTGGSNNSSATSIAKRPTASAASSASRVPSASGKPVAKPAAKPAAKKISLAPKDNDDADGWDDGW